MLSRLSTRTCGGFLILGLLALSVSCGPNYKARAIVKGKVTFGGKSLTTGSVMFLGENKLSSSSTIDKNGNYEMMDAPIGKVIITVSVPKLPPGGMGMMKGGPAMKGGGKDVKSVDPEDPGKSISIMGEMPTHVVPIPDKYQNEATSGLTYTVEKGEHTHDITLTP